VPTNVSADITASVPANTPADITASMPINASTQTFTWADEELVESSTDIVMNMSEKSGADIAAFSDSGYNFQPQNRYTFLNDDLGSTMRMSNGAGVLQATYAYDEFGQEILDGINTLKNALGKVADLVNPFGFVGYQRDNIADDYFAEAREYRPEEGRFSGTDVIQGTIEMPFTLNRYGYCYNNGMLMNDLNGMWPNPIKWVKDKTKKAAKAVGSAVKSVGNYVKSHKRQIIGGLIQGTAILGAAALVAFSGGAAAPLVAGAIMGAGCSLGSQIANNKDGKIDWGDVAIQGAAGAAFAVLPGAVVGKSVTGLARYAGIGAVNAAIGGAATLATDLKNGEKKEQIVKDVAASTASNFVCGMLNEKVNTEIGHSLDEMKAEKQRPFTEKINELEDDIASRQDKVRGLNRARKAKGVTGRGKNAKGKAMLTHNKNIKKLKEARTENENISKQVCREIDIKYGPLIRGLQKTMDWLYGIELEGGLEGFIQKQMSGVSSCAT